MPMHKNQNRTAGTMALPESDPAKFYEDIANGLHAMAQPLTILRASMEVLSLPASAGIDQRRYMEISAAQLERTCNLFTRVQDLVTARYVEAQKQRYELWAVIAPLIDDHRNRLQASGTGIAVANQGPWAPILGDVERTEQAIAAILQISAEMVERGDVIEISTASPSGFLELVIENTRQNRKTMSSSARLSLALAEENILSQQGKYAFSKDPFRVSLALPVEKLEGGRGETSLRRCETNALH